MLKQLSTYAWGTYSMHIYLKINSVSFFLWIIFRLPEKIVVFMAIAGNSQSSNNFTGEKHTMAEDEWGTRFWRWKWTCQLLRCVWLFVTPMDCRPSGFSVHGILQARILEWVAISFSRRSSRPRDGSHFCISGRFFTIWASREAPLMALKGNSS